MSINKLLLAGVTGTFLAGSAVMAAEPVKLTDAQMDDVTAGFFGSSVRLTIGVQNVKSSSYAKKGQLVNTNETFKGTFKDETKVNETYRSNSNGECGTLIASSKLSANVTTTSSTKALQFGRSSHKTHSTTIAGTLSVEPSVFLIAN